MFPVSKLCVFWLKYFFGIKVLVIFVSLVMLKSNKFGFSINCNLFNL